MAFTTNITGVPTTGQYGPDGKPLNVNNDGGIEVTPQDAGNVPSAGTESRISGDNDKILSGNPYNQDARSTDTPSPVGNPNMGNYAESISERVVDEGSWNSFTAEYSTPPFSAESGYWNIGNSSEASPYINTLKVDNSIQADNIMTMGIGGSSRPVVPERNAPPCDCPRFASDEDGGYNRPDPQWGKDEYVLKEGEACQPPRANEVIYPEAPNQGRFGGQFAQLRNIKLPYFSGVHFGLTGIFAIVPFNCVSEPPWINDLGQDKDLFDDGGGDCWPNQKALRTAINGGNYPGANCTYKHLLVGYRGSAIDNFGVSGANWKGWCFVDDALDPLLPIEEASAQRSDNSYEFYESRVGGNCSGKPGYLYACDHDGSISELTPMYQWTVQDSCDCLALYDNGRWTCSATLPTKVGWDGPIWVQNAEPDWDASNIGSGSRTGDPTTQVYWTGAGCWTGFGWDDNGQPIENLSGEWDETKVFAIVATGGGGPGAGDNIPPYWSDTDCDWMYAIRQVVSGDCADESKKIEGSPSGPTIKIGLTKLHDATCGPDKQVGKWPNYELERIPCSGIDWECSLSGTGEDPGSSGYCTSIYNRGPLYPNGDYVCYASGTGNVPGSSGPYWIVNSDSNWFNDSGVACNWIYDLQYYNPNIPGPSGALQTGILESAISTGCA